jgi:hypothetical protein
LQLCVFERRNCSCFSQELVDGLERDARGN